MKTVKNILASVAVASFVLAQPAAAATRSYQSLPQTGVHQPVAADRVAAPVQDAEQLHALGGLGILLIFGGLLGIMAAAGVFDNGKDSTG